MSCTTAGMEAIADRARAAAVEAELERATKATERLDAARRRAETLAPQLIEQWLEDQRVPGHFVLGPVTTPDPGGIAERWNISVRLTGPHPDDDLELVLALELGGMSPDGQPHAWWMVPRTCARCQQTVPVHAGWTLADLGRALDRDLDHQECIARPAVLIEKHPLYGENPDMTDTAARIEALERDGYVVSALPDDGWLVLIGRRDHYAGAF